jgi:hypothetical protein
MSRLITLVAVLALGLGLVISTAWAAQNPAVNANACAQAGGVFVSSGPPPHNSCTVGGGTTVERVSASHPTQDWEVEITTTLPSDVYTFTPNDPSGDPHGHTTTPGSSEITNCFNGSGQSIGGFESNPNCQPKGGTS